MNRKKDTRIQGIVVVGNKKYAIKLIIFPKEGQMVDILNAHYRVAKVNFKEVKSRMIPIVYLKKTICRGKNK